VRFNGGDAEYFPKQIIDIMVNGKIPIDTTYEYDEADRLLMMYMNDQVENIYSINFDELEEFTYYKPTWVNMIKVPLLLYVLKGYYKLFIKKTIF
jgi:hypothetical protein